METSFGKVRVKILCDDITTVDCEAIVNAANSSLRGGGGVDGAIHFAGGPAILDDCERIVEEQGELPEGHAVVTTGGDLPADKVIHTVGPVWHGGGIAEAEILASCYESSLILAEEMELGSIAFPAISAGVYGYPFEDACRVSFEAVRQFCLSQAEHIKEVQFIYYTPEDAEAAASILSALAEA